jgi:hypothetical protein
VSWPDHPVVGLAYLDQLVRDDALAGETATALRTTLQAAVDPAEAGERDADLADELSRLAGELPSLEDGAAAARRVAGLRGVLEGVAGALR